MPIIEDLIKAFGESGFPKVVDISLIGTWDAFQSTAPKESNTLTRVLNVLGFLHLLRQSGMKNKISVKEAPEVTYKKLRAEQFAVSGVGIGRHLIRYRLFDALRVFKSVFVLETPTRSSDTRLFHFDLCLVPKRKEHLDGALAKLSGLLYSGELPTQLKESWRKIPVNSTAKPKSNLPKYTSLVSNGSTLGFLPLFVSNKTDGYAIYAKRAADDMLILRIVLTLSAPTPIWLTARKHDDLLKSLLSKSLTKLKG